MTAVLMVQDETVSTPGPREGGPRRRRAFTVTEKMKHLTAYEAACAGGDGGGGAGRICGKKGFTPRRSRSGGSCATPVCWRGSNRVRRSADRRRLRWRSPG